MPEGADARYLLAIVPGDCRINFKSAARAMWHRTHYAVGQRLGHLRCGKGGLLTADGARRAFEGADARYLLAIVPGDCRINFKSAARAIGGKKSALHRTHYAVGQRLGHLRCGKGGLLTADGARRAFEIVAGRYAAATGRDVMV
jgi:hypothetical protein